MEGKTDELQVLRCDGKTTGKEGKEKVGGRVVGKRMCIKEHISI